MLSELYRMPPTLIVKYHGLHNNEDFLLYELGLSLTTANDTIFVLSAEICMKKVFKN
jgi:hypothetical protein